MFLKKSSIFTLNLTIVITLTFLFTLKTQAEIKCIDWDNAITNNQELHESYQFKRTDIGVFYDFEWDKKKK